MLQPSSFAQPSNCNASVSLYARRPSCGISSCAQIPRRKTGLPLRRICLPDTSMVLKPTRSSILSDDVRTITWYRFGFSGVQNCTEGSLKLNRAIEPETAKLFLSFSSGISTTTDEGALFPLNFTHPSTTAFFDEGTVAAGFFSDME